MDLKGKVAIVTGSSSGTGIGSETAKLLAARGCNVVVNYVNSKASAEETVSACTASGVEAMAVKADVSKDGECRALVARTIERWGRLDVLVNNAATTKPIAEPNLEAIDAAEFQRVFAVNLLGPFQMTRAAAAHLRAAGDAAVINISSLGAWTGGGSSIAYTTSKAALNSLTISFARVLAPQVRVNAICPGGLLGNWTSKMISPEAYKVRVKEAEDTYPLRRAVWPIDVARLAVALVTEATAMTGELIRMDAGRHMMTGDLVKTEKKPD